VSSITSRTGALAGTSSPTITEAADHTKALRHEAWWAYSRR
jgi:hypothetical protein